MFLPPSEYFFFPYFYPIRKYSKYSLHLTFNWKRNNTPSLRRLERKYCSKFLFFSKITKRVKFKTIKFFTTFSEQTKISKNCKDFTKCNRANH